MAGYAIAFAVLWAAGGASVFDLDALVKERESTLASFRDPHASPLAAVARHDFAGDRPMTFGSAPGSDVPLEGVPARAAVVRALPDGFEMEREGKIERLAPGAKVPLGSAAGPDAAQIPASRLVGTMNVRAGPVPVVGSPTMLPRYCPQSP